MPAPRGRHLDSRALLRSALRTDGEPVRLPRRHNPMQERPLTLVVDVSGSMAPYAMALLWFAHAVLHAGHPVEVFTVGVQPTRVTDELRRPSLDVALTAAAAMAAALPHVDVFLPGHNVAAIEQLCAALAAARRAA